MERRGLAALIATTPENQTYLSGYGYPVMRRSNYTGQSYVAIARDPQVPPFMVIGAMGLSLLGQQGSWITDVRTFGPSGMEMREDKELPAEMVEVQRYLREAKSNGGPVENLVTALRERGLDRARLGMDEMGVGPAVLEQVRAALPAAELIAAYDTFREIRAVKTPEEVERLRLVAQLTVEAIKKTMSAIREGVTERELCNEYFAAFAAHGGEPRIGAIGCGPRSALPSTVPWDYALRAGDLIRFDVGGLFDFYYGGVSRTAVLGEPRPEYRRHFEAVYAAHLTALEMVKPGVRAADLFSAGVEAGRRHGIPHFKRRHLGHGIGIEAYDLPNITPDSQAMLEAGMVINIEPPYYELGLGGFTIEDTLVVTETGFEWLSVMDRDMQVL
jgi:Xaa-Pro aminopeptidase